MIFISRLKARNFKSFKFIDITFPRTFLCFAGPNGSGKCVDGETEVLFADGSRLKIRDIVNEAIQKGNVENIDDGYIAHHTSKKILCLDTNSLKTTQKHISAFVKRKSPEFMLRIKTRSGREVVSTEYHPLFIFDGSGVKAVKAEELGVGSKIAVPRNLHISDGDPFFTELLDSIDSKDLIYVSYDPRFIEIIKKTSMTYSSLEKKAGIPSNIIASLISKQSINFAYLVKLMRCLGLLDLEIMQLIQKVKGKRNFHSYLFPWKNSDELCRFLGYLLSEGQLNDGQIRFTNGDKEIVSDYVSLVQKIFGITPTVNSYKPRSYDVLFYSNPLSRIFTKFGMSDEGTGKKFISNLILSHSSDQNLRNLLNGLYSGDGYVSKNSIEITSKSKRLADDIFYILLRLGLSPRIVKHKKEATNSGYVGEYFTVRLFGLDNFKRFESVSLVSDKKRDRIADFLSQELASNPNVDLIAANSLVKNTAQDLGINVKKMKKEFPKIDAYCYNQCTPSRLGIGQLIQELFVPAQKSQGTVSESLSVLEKLAYSDIFWDEIVSIEKITPKEEWVYDLCVPEHHNFIANNFFVHNSNVLDMVRFALGETSLKSLRAKKTKDLIHTGGKAAEVTLYFEGDEKIEVKRAIRIDGKILYKLNGEKTTRFAIQNLLKRYNLDESGRNIIAQGEVQRIINMGGKERRGIIDSVAGIADFEEKKKEAMKELDVVDVRIKDASLVLGERTAYLEDLAKERELAIKYKDSRKKLSEAKATLLKTEIKKMEHSFSEVSGNIDKLESGIKKKEAEILEVNERISVVEEKRNEKRKVLESKQKTSMLIRKIEELKALLRSGTQLIEDRNIFLKKLEEDSLKLSKELERCDSELPTLEGSISDFKSEQKAFESQLSNLQMHESDESHKLREKIDAEEKSMHSIRENIVRIDTEISSKNELIQHKASMLSALSKDIGEFDSNSMDKEIAAMKRESTAVMKEIEDYFSETKECNKKIAEIDKQLLELKEKGSFLRVSISPALANPALKFIAELKSSGKVDGIHGLVGELIKFDQEYSNAVESAAGNRLLYVVVDNAETASKVITLLKKSDAGRATFIPIDEVKVSESRPVSGFEPLLKHVSFSNSVRRAIEFVFSDTTLVPKMADAKKNIGAGRMVTLEGEIFERSGVISGGRMASNILAGMQLKKLDEQLAQMKAEKESLINRLYSIREEESEKRSKKSKIDLEIRSLEIELQKQGEKKKEQEDIFKTKDRLQSEINTVKTDIKSKHVEKEQLGLALVALEKQIAELNVSLSKSELKYKEISDASNKRRTELTAKISSLKATVEGKMKELELKKREYYSTDERIKQLSKEKKDALDSINDAKRKLNENNDELSKSESEMEKYSKDIESLFKALNEFDAQLQELGKSRGEVTISIEKFNKDMNTVLVKKATLETRIQDLKAEYESYKDVPVDESLGKEELNSIIKECESILSQLGDVNLASIEKYEEKKREVDDVRQKIDKLSEERTAILQVMSEIEDRKKEAFFSTFYAVSDNFQKMFKHISIGEGFLYMDNPNSPFDSGLFIKLKRYGREHTLDSLSGGENSLVALMFIFALQFFKPAPFYILDEVDAALDKENSKNLALLISEVSKTAGTQFVIVSHNDAVMSNAHAVLGVAKVDGASKIVGVNLEQLAKGA